MSKIMTEDELIEHISNALSKIDNMLHSLRLSSKPKDRDKSMKVAYWLDKYSDFVLKERDFNPAGLPSYKRRSIINVDFGFRLGSEIGGWHYAVVLDKNNNRSSDVITVLPLVSLKPHSKDTPFTVILSDGIYGAYSKKFETQITAAKKLLIEADALYNDAIKIPEETERKINIIQAELKYGAAKKLISECEYILEHIKKLKGGTVACISQITTISKRRIVSPKHHKDILYDIKISPEEMKLIEDAIKNLYISK